MVLGSLFGGISLLIGFAVLAAAAFVVLGVWLLFGRPDGGPLRQPYPAYLGIVVFVSLLFVLGSAHELTSAIAGAIVDQPIGTSCDEGEVFVEVEPVIGELRESVGAAGSAIGPGGAVGELLPPDSAVAQGPPGLPQQPVPTPPRRPPMFSPPGPEDCEAIGARDRAAARVAESGTALIVAAGILLFHARAGRRLLDEETRDA